LYNSQAKGFIFGRERVDLMNSNSFFKKLKKWQKKATIFLMSGVFSLTGCASQDQNEDLKRKAEKRMYDIVKEAELNENDEKQEVAPRMISVYKDEIEEIVEKEEIHPFDQIDLSNYSGYSLVDALNSVGCNSSFEVRAQIAAHFGIKNYRGTSSQNITLLLMLQGKLPSKANQKEVKDNLKEEEVSVVSIVQEETLEVSQSEKDSSDNKEHSSNNKKPGSTSDQDKEEQPSAGEEPDDNQKPEEPEKPGVVPPTEDDKKPEEPEKPGVIPPTEDDKKPEEEDKPEHPIHSYVLDHYDEHMEYHICSCGDVKQVLHVMDDGKELEDSSILYSCMNEGCDYTKTYVPEHICEWGEWYALDNLQEQRDCACGNKQNRDHTYTSDVVYDILGNGKHTETETNTCSTCSNVYSTSEDFTCDYKIIDTTEVDEIKACVCGDEIVNQHLFDTGHTDANGNFILSCVNEGCNYTKPGHVHTPVTTFETVSTEDYCGDEVKTCSECNQEIERTPIYEHDYVVSGGPVNKQYDCLRCTYSYTEKKNPWDKKTLQESVSSNNFSGEQVGEERGYSRTRTLD